MAKKHKNLRHTEAMRRKAEATAEMAKLGLKLDDDIVLIGFVFDHLSVSHLTYLGLVSINKLCKDHVGVDICIFSQHIIQPCVSLLCPAFSTSDLMRWRDYPLISTSIETTIDALSSNAPVVYHYCFDPSFVNKPHKESSILVQAFCDPRVRVIARHESHRELIEAEFDIKVQDTIIPDCNTEMLVKLILKEMKNANESNE